jgi:predicted ATPase
MELYTLAGQRNAALRQYQECVRILEKELGVAPLQETTQLYQDIKEQRGQWSSKSRQEPAPEGSPPHAWQAAPDAAPPFGMESIQGTRIPFVGRELEWEFLQRSYNALQRDGCLIVLEGEAGIGKTRLAEEFLAFARAGGAGGISAHCYAGETQLAYAPFVAGISAALNQGSGSAAQGSPVWHQALQGFWLAEAARLLPELSRLRPDIPNPPPADSPGAQARFYEGLSQVILALCGAQPAGVLFIDDLHFADEASLDLLTYLVRRLHDRPLLILATWRGEDLAPDHRLRSLLAEAQRQGRGAGLALSRLSAEAVSQIASAFAHGGELSVLEFNQKLHRETEGLPFFVVEYLAALREVAAFSSEDWPIPLGVRDLLHSRLMSAGETGWQLLQAAAVLGRSFDFDTLQEASGRSEDETISALEQLILRGLIREVQPVSSGGDQLGLRQLDYDFSHEKLRSLVYSETSLARRRLLHQRAAEALVARGRHDLSALSGQIAYHYKQGGRAREAAEYYRMAGEHARALYANTEALAHFQAALSLGHADTAGLNEAIGELYTLQGGYPAAIRSYESALAQVASQPLATARLALRLGEIYHRLGDLDQAESYFQSGISVLQPGADAAAQAHLYAAWSRTAHQRGLSQRASELALQALDLARAAADQPGLAQAHNLLGILARRQGELPEATRHLEQSLVIAQEMDSPAAQIAALNNLSLVYADLGNVEKAIGYASQALNLCLQLGDRHRAAALHNNLADLYHASGCEAEAMAHLKQAVVIFAEVGGDVYRPDSAQVNPEIWKLTEW